MSPLVVPAWAAPASTLDASRLPCWAGARATGPSSARTVAVARVRDGAITSSSYTPTTMSSARTVITALTDSCSPISISSGAGRAGPRDLDGAQSREVAHGGRCDATGAGEAVPQAGGGQAMCGLHAVDRALMPAFETPVGTLERRHPRPVVDGARVGEVALRYAERP